jgi:hypothetical protein
LPGDGDAGSDDDEVVAAPAVTAAVSAIGKVIKSEELTMETDTVLAELVQQRALREEFEKRLQDIEAESARISGENLVLKQLVSESRSKQELMQDKMNRLLKVLYTLFITGSSSQLIGGVRPAVSLSMYIPAYARCACTTKHAGYMCNPHYLAVNAHKHVYTAVYVRQVISKLVCILCA